MSGCRCLTSITMLVGCRRRHLLGDMRVGREPAAATPPNPPPPTACPSTGAPARVSNNGHRHKRTRSYTFSDRLPLLSEPSLLIAPTNKLLGGNKPTTPAGPRHRPTSNSLRVAAGSTPISTSRRWAPCQHRWPRRIGDKAISGRALLCCDRPGGWRRRQTVTWFS